MPLEQDGDIVRMVECPFCDADLRDEPSADHLKECEEFHRAAGDVEPRDCTRDGSDGRKAAANSLSLTERSDT